MRVSAEYALANMYIHTELALDLYKWIKEDPKNLRLLILSISQATVPSSINKQLSMTEDVKTVFKILFST